jgi:tetratricopeptide (TPR) repeat protein
MGRKNKKGGQPGATLAERRSAISKEQEEEEKLFLKRAVELRQEGNRHFSQARWEHAKQSYEKALQVCSGKYAKEAATLHSNLGAIHILQRNFADAVKECTLALEIDPYALRARQRRSRAHELTGNLLAALSDVRFLIKLLPSASDKVSFLANEQKILDQLRKVSASHREGQEARARALKNKEAKQISVKLELAGNIRLVEVDDDMNYAQLKATAMEKFSDLTNFNVKAKDEEGDCITLTCKKDIGIALRASKSPKFVILEAKEEKAVISPPKKELDSTKVAPDIADSIVETQQPKPAAEEKQEDEVYELDDWMIDFAELFKEHLGVDIDTPLDLSKEAWEKCAEALDAAVHNSKSEKLLRQAANKFKDVILTALVNLGNVYMCIARKYIDAKGEEENTLEAITKADKELDAAERTYKTALERKPDFADSILSLGQLEFEKGKISMSFGTSKESPEGHKYHSSTSEGHFSSAIDFFKQSLDLLSTETETENSQAASEEPPKEGNNNQAGNNAEVSHDSNLKAQAQVMWGNALYELSQCFASSDKEWNATLQQAIEKFKDAKCRTEEVSNALQMHCKADEIDKEAIMKGFGDNNTE